MKKICIITNGYPTSRDPYYAFIRPVVHAFVENGIICDVIAPQSVTKILLRGKTMRPPKWYDYSKSGKKITIYQPYSISISNIKLFGYSISEFFRICSVKWLLKKEKIVPDCFYAHFWDCGILAATVAKNVPVVVISGESKIWVKNRFPTDYIESYLKNVKGVIAVSQKNLIESESLGLLKYCPKVSVIPNAYDPLNFYFENRRLSFRRNLCLKDEDFVICFVGNFSNRKGVERLIAAAKKDPDVKLVLIGSGKKIVLSRQIVHCGPVPHNQIVHYLNASDIFVLPTLAEGCCNAIVEAMACGLPIVSSNLPFNDDILDSNNSIRVNPESIDEIFEAIVKLRDNQILRQKMGNASIKKSVNMTMDSRAKKIISFCERVIKD